MIDPVTTTVVVGYIAIKILDSLIEKGVDETYDSTVRKLRGENSLKSFKICLIEAIRRYSLSGNKIAFTKTLLSKNSPLLQEDVAHEMAQILKFGREPNYELIADRWRDTIEDLPQWIDMSLEARLLTTFLKDELQATETFGPVFDSKNLNSINENVAITAISMANINKKIENLINLIDSRFGDLNRTFSRASYDINMQIRDFSLYVEEKTQSFVGRKFVFESINKFCEEHKAGYLFIKGDPGIGKTALAAEYVKQKGCVHHFNNRAIGINRTETFLKSICAQLIAAYKLNYSFLPPEATQDSQFIIRILNEVSTKIDEGDGVVIFIDAIDEVEDVSSIEGSNLLFLPPSLPKGIYFIVTTRNTDLRLKIECDQMTFILKQDSVDNLNDIREFISSKMVTQGIEKYISDKMISNEEFLNVMVQKSQGNFMYLHYVIPDIEQGLYIAKELYSLPLGLQNYYEDHWRRMRIQSENDWLEYKLPVVIALSIAKEPISMDLISEFSHVEDQRHIMSILHEWQQFLYVQSFLTESGWQKRWRVYHDSFREFISKKDQVEGEHVNLLDAHQKIADSLWDDLYKPDENPRTNI